MKPVTDLVSLLRERASALPDQLAYQYIGDTRGPERLTYGELAGSALDIAAHLFREGPTGGERMLLLFDPGLEFIQGFLGAICSGGIAVPAPPPNPLKPKRSLQRLESILKNARPTVALTTSPVLETLRPALDELPAWDGVHWLCVDRVEAGGASWPPIQVDPQSVAMLQYTSGSTSEPKGAALTHANLLHNVRYFDEGWDHAKGTVALNWLPAFHDLGLVYGILAPLWGGFPALQMSPIDVIQNPYAWLRAISDHKVTHTSGPNFIYDLCSRKVPADKVATLNLKSWKMALTAAEPIRAETLARFAERFGPAGFKRQTFCAGYGMSEATCKVTSVACGDTTRVLSLDGAALERNAVVPVAPGPRARQVVGCGRPGFGVEVAIIDPQTRIRRPAATVGEIWVSGPSVAHSYWEQASETKTHLRARIAGGPAVSWLRTGDLGFMHEGELYVTGRIKDMLIVRGANHYPQDIESTVQDAHAAIRPGCVAAFAIDEGGEERLAVVAEVETKAAQASGFDPDAVVATITRAVSEQHGLRVDRLVLIRAGTIPKTTSGKIQRRATRQAMLGGELTVLKDEAIQRTPEPIRVRNDLRTRIIQIVTQVTSLPVEKMEPDTSLYSLGVDSLSGVNIAYEIGMLTGQDVPSHILSERDTITKLVDYVISVGGPR